MEIDLLNTIICKYTINKYYTKKKFINTYKVYNHRLMHSCNAQFKHQKRNKTAIKNSLGSGAFFLSSLISFIPNRWQ